MTVQRNSEKSCQNKKPHDDLKSGEFSSSNVIPVDRKIPAEFSNEIIPGKLDAGKKPDQAKAVISLQGSSKLGFIILGFVFGLLMSIAVLILYKLDNIVSPVEAKNEIAGRMKEIENNFAHKLQSIQQQREADLEKYKSMVQEQKSSLSRAAALQRDRDAALAIAKARAELLQAKLEAERGAPKAHGATKKASSELSGAVSPKARLSQQQKTEAEHASAEVSTSAANEAISTSLDKQKQSGADKNATGFQSNPCDGPTAVLLSSCK